MVAKSNAFLDYDRFNLTLGHCVFAVFTAPHETIWLYSIWMFFSLQQFAAILYSLRGNCSSAFPAIFLSGRQQETGFTFLTQDGAEVATQLSWVNTQRTGTLKVPSLSAKIN